MNIEDPGMSPRNQKTARKQDLPNSQASRSDSAIRPANSGTWMLSSKQILTMCLLPLWLVAIIVFDKAVADFRDQAFFASVRADLAELAQPQEPTEPDVGQLQQIKRTFYVDPDKEGNLNGRISAIELAGISPVEQELKVALVQRGQEIRTAKTAGGQFTLENVPTGDAGETYTLIASGRNGFLAYAIHVRPPVVPFNPEDASNSPQQENNYQFVSFSPTTSSAADLLFARDLQIEAAAIPPTFLELERIIENLIPPDTILANTAADIAPPQGKALEIEGSFEYSLNDDGSFSGRILLPNGENESRDLSDMNVFLLQNDKEVGQDDVGENGDFSIQNVQAGVYAFVAAGKDGFAALSLRLTPATDNQSGSLQVPDEHYVSLTNKPEDPEFTVVIITDPDDLKYCRDTIRQLNQAEDDDRRAALIPDQFNPIEFGAFPNGGFGAPAGGFGAPTGGFGSGGFGSSGGFSIGGNGLLLRRALLGAAIALPIALGGSEPPPITPSQTE
jgi:hypothetical protein